ncbi:MAG: PorT family protein [Saprospiraceae bacterium]|nr:PorT family protein [Saprospiraceae bacterium]
MKKRIIYLAVILMSTSTIISAQFSAGIRVGGNLNNVSLPSVIDLIAPNVQYLPGVNVGLTGEYAVNDQFSVLSEVNYQEKGFRIRERMDVNLLNINIPLGVRVDTKVRYLDLPVMAKYAFGNGVVKAYIAAGPQVSYALNGRIKTKADFLVDFNVTNIPINFSAVNYQRFDFAGVVAAGVDFPTGNGKIFFDARYSQGLSDSFKLPVIDLNIKNHGFGFGIGYKMAL